jgi:NTE family protein
MTSGRGRKQKAINLALQGGGSHGAFTWGVLDRLLEDERLDLEAISGTSAGAVNAVVVADGLMRGGRQGAREALGDLWAAVGEAGRSSPMQRTPIDVLLGSWNLDRSPGYLTLDVLHRLASPYDLNPLNINPLRHLIESIVDFERVRSCNKMKLFISATNVETGRVKVFDREKLTCEMVLASACLPFMFQAVEIDGAPYWDGGYMGNPVLYPFFNACDTGDVVIVQINPIERKGTPRSARDILNRVNEITFNSSLLREFRAIDFVARLLDDGQLDPAQYKQVLVHRIAAEEEILPLGASSKLNTEGAFLSHLFEVGRRAAEDWLSVHFADLGKRSSIDLRAMFQGA